MKDFIYLLIGIALVFGSLFIGEAPQYLNQTDCINCIYECRDSEDPQSGFSFYLPDLIMYATNGWQSVRLYPDRSLISSEKILIILPGEDLLQVFPDGAFEYKRSGQIVSSGKCRGD